MEIGLCPACARSYTAGEVAGLGILRPRPAHRGGPRVEFACPGCNRQIELIPYGQGRYARPGEPPPPAVPAEARRPPWVGAVPPPGETAKASQTPGGEEEPEIPVWEVETPEEEPPQAGPEAAGQPAPDPAGGALAEDGAPPSLEEALLLLGVGPEATHEEIELAFRKRSLACHPDKVAHLDEDFQALAERKFRRLRAAFDVLSR